MRDEEGRDELRGPVVTHPWKTKYTLRAFLEARKGSG